MTLHTPVNQSNTAAIFRCGLLRSALVAAICASTHVAWAQAWPARPVRLVLGAPAATAPDIAARLVGERLSALWGQPVLIDNRPGVGGMIAMDLVKAAPADGYTLMFAHSGAVSVTPKVIKAAKYDPINDFTALGMVADSPMMMVARPEAPDGTLSALLKSAKARPGSIAIGSTEPATYPYLIGQAIAQATSTTFLHVPFNQPGQAIQALSTGDVSYHIDGLAALMPLVKSGRVKAVAISTDRVLPGLEGIPLMKDAVPGYSVVGWFALLGPKTLPADVASKINRDLNQVLSAEDLNRRMNDIYLYPVPKTQFETTNFLKQEVERWGAAIDRADIKTK